MKRKRLAALLLSLCMTIALLSGMAVTASAAAAPIYWGVTAGNELILSGAAADTASCVNAGSFSSDSCDFAGNFPWQTRLKTITKVTVKGTVAPIGSVDHLFELNQCTTMNLGGLDTSNVTSMEGMFFNCKKLTSLDVSNFDTANVTNMSEMFIGCEVLTDLDLSGFDTSKVTTMWRMFSGCGKLTSLDVSNFDTAKVYTMGEMFDDCEALTTLDLSNFDTSNVTNMRDMFNGCTALTNLDVSNFDTANVTYMDGMFYNCKALTNLDVSNFDTANVTDMGGMFSGCGKLTSIDVSNFDTSNVTSADGMWGMFSRCAALTSLDLSSFVISKPASTYGTENMFSNMEGLETLTISDSMAAAIGKDNTGLSALYAMNGCTATIYLKDKWGKIAGLTAGTYATSFTPTHTLEEHAAIPASCEVDGAKAYWICLVCGKHFSDVDGDTEIADLDAWKVGEGKIAATGHVYDNDWDATCNVCGYTREVGPVPIYYWGVTADNELILSSVEADTAGCTDKGSFPSDSCDFVGNAPWKTHRAMITKVTVKGKVAPIGSVESLFSSLYQCTTMDLGGLDTSNVTSMKGMFFDCKALTDLDISNFDTAKVTNMWCMFTNCGKLTSLDLSNFDTSKVTDMSSMFSGCTALTSLDLSGFDTSKMTGTYNANFMLSKLEGLKTLTINDSVAAAIGKYNTGLTALYSVVNGCTATAYLKDGDGKIAGLTAGTYATSFTPTHTLEEHAAIPASCEADGAEAYWTCSVCGKHFSDVDGDTEIADLAAWKAGEGKIAATGHVYDNDQDATCNVCGYIRTVGSAPIYWGVTAGNELILSSVEADTAGCTDKGSFPSDRCDFSNVDSTIALHRIPWNAHRTTITKVTVKGTVALVGDADYFFYNLEQCTTMDLSGLDTSNVTDMGGMFTECRNLTALDLSHFDTSKVTSMNRMFWDCKAMRSLDVSGFDTAKVTDMDYIFYNCQQLISLDLSHFVTSKITSMSWMFGNCNALRSLDVSGFDTAKVTNMSAMFVYCGKLNALDLSHFVTSEVTDMSNMFGWCTDLTNLDVSGFDTAKVTNMSYMFGSCGALTDLDLSSFDTSQITVGFDAQDMLFGLEGLKTLAISDSVAATMGKYRSGMADLYTCTVAYPCDGDGKIAGLSAGTYSTSPGTHHWGKWTLLEDGETLERVCDNDAAHTESETLSVDVAKGPFICNGTAQKPEVTLKVNGTAVLTKDADYTVAYADNVNAGTGKITITGKGDYEFSLKRDFTIDKAAEPIVPKPQPSISDDDDDDDIYFTLTATTGAGGSIAPSGKVSVRWNGSKTFTITPAEGYAVADVLVDGKSVGTVGSYTFEKVLKAHTIEASFQAVDKISNVECPKDDTCPIHAFSDAKTTAWYHDGVHYCLEKGLMKGCGKGRFAPGDTMTRSMLVQILYNEAGRPDVSGSSPFNDVASGAWYYKAVIWATENGIVKGYRNGGFGPEDPITREQLAVMLWRYVQCPATDGTLDSFTDCNKASAWAADALRWVVEQGIVTGKTGSVLDPTGTAVRTEAATMIQRFCESAEK